MTPEIPIAAITTSSHRISKIALQAMQEIGMTRELELRMVSGKNIMDLSDRSWIG